MSPEFEPGSVAAQLTARVAELEGEVETRKSILTGYLERINEQLELLQGLRSELLEAGMLLDKANQDLELKSAALATAQAKVIEQDQEIARLRATIQELNEAAAKAEEFHLDEISAKHLQVSMQPSPVVSSPFLDAAVEVARLANESGTAARLTLQHTGEGREEILELAWGALE